jgi:ribosomal protein S18 acetylase RimI-like enzyme
LDANKAIVKQAKEKDIPIVLNFVKSYYDFESIEFKPNRITKSLKELINSDNIGRVWLIYLNQKPIGYIVLCFSFSLESHGQDGIIDEFFIEEQYRNQGLGENVLKLVIQKSKKLGLKALYLEVNNINIAAQNLYKKTGFLSRDKYFLMNLKL